MWFTLFLEKYLRWTVASILVFIGLLTVDTASWKWAALGLFIYTTPLILQWTPWRFIRASSLWVGLFVFLQTAYGYHFPNYFYHLPPNHYAEIDVGRPEIGTITLSTDSLGFRTTKKILYHEKSDLRVFAIGASTTQQAYLNATSTWEHLLQEKLSQDLGKDAQVINTAIAGTRGIHHLATLKHIRSYHPDLIVFLMGINDWNRHISETFLDTQPPDAWGFTERRTDRYSLKYSFLARLLGSLHLFRTSVDPVLAQTAPLLAQTGQATENAQIQHDPMPYFYFPSRPVRHVFRPQSVDPGYASVLSNIGRTCHEMGVRCLFASQPNAYQPGVSDALKSKFWMTPPFLDFTLDLDSLEYVAKLYNTTLLQFAKANGHIACDLARAIPASQDFFYDDVHFTPHAQKSLAETLSACIEQALHPKT